ncbi:MAG TPA: PfkB family carbohydrate kinase [Solirubrobacteraceae bacterium]|nr:PfkB family carbohydrate kinase [Solirubrobacteraceae bacterium]
MKPRLQFHYTAVGHVTVDVLEDGTRQAGGSALYSALQAARLGLRALVLTRGVPHEIETLLAPYQHELELHVQRAPHTTTLLTSGAGELRSQRLLAWAGVIEPRPAPPSAILHLAPVARELPRSWPARAQLLALTPQGLARHWAQPPSRFAAHAHRARAGGAPVEHRPPGPAGVELAGRCHAMVLSQHERACCSELVGAALRARAVVAVTHGAQPTEVLHGPPPRRGELEQVAPLRRVVEDLGAGDVFAAAFFIALHRGQPPRRAARFANAAAAVRMSARGPGAVGRAHELERRLRAAAAERCPRAPGAPLGR